MIILDIHLFGVTEMVAIFFINMD